MNQRNKGAFGATLTGIVNGLSGRSRIPINLSDCRVDQQSFLVTGAGGGLGKAVATHLASLGAKVVMGVRNPDPEPAVEIRRASSSDQVEMMQLDLSSFASVNAFVEQVLQRNLRFDGVVLNAAVVTVEAEQTDDGLDRMVQVNFLSNVLLMERLLREHRIQRSQGPSRIVVVSSEAHRWTEAINVDTLDEFRPFGVRRILPHYSDTKFMMAAYASHLSRRLDPDSIGVHALCPGAVNSNLARRAPVWSKPLIKLVFSLFFASPAKAAIPVVYLCGSLDLEGQTGVYLHMRVKKAVDERASDPEFSKTLTEKALSILEKRGLL